MTSSLFEIYYTLYIIQFIPKHFNDAKNIAGKYIPALSLLFATFQVSGINI